MKAAIICLKLGAIQTVLMGVYHFGLGYQFDWNKYMERTNSPTINWTLFALNDYFSFLLLIIGALLMYLVFKYGIDERVVFPLLVLSMFWLFSSIYQAFSPMPLPARLSWIGSVLLGVALFNAALFIYALFYIYRQRT